MTQEIQILKKGEIRRPSKTKFLIKAVGPLDAETVDENGKIIELKSYFPTNDFPGFHYIVVIDIFDSYHYPGNKFCICHLITNSTSFGNLKIIDELYDKNTTTIDLSNSYITRDKFLLPIGEIKTNIIYGNFDLDKLLEILR